MLENFIPCTIEFWGNMLSLYIYLYVDIYFYTIFIYNIIQYNIIQYYIQYLYIFVLGRAHEHFKIIMTMASTPNGVNVRWTVSAYLSYVKFGFIPMC